MFERVLIGLLTVCLCIACGDEGESGVLQLSSADQGDLASDAGLTDAGINPTDVMTADMAAPADVGIEGTLATLRLINPATGQGFSGVTVTGPNNAATTDATGRATVGVAPGVYQVALEAPGARTHRVWGVATESAFEQITYVSPDMITGFVFGSLGLTDDPSMGILVVGLDTPSLAPAVGAEASIDGEHGTPFVFAGSRPAAGRTIPMGGQGFVTFPNVTPGTISVNTNYPGGSCAVFPAETEDNTVEVVGGEVTVIAFTCRSTP